MICLQSVPCHSIYNLNLQTSLKRIQESLIVSSQLTDAGPEQTQRTEGKVRVFCAAEQEAVGGTSASADTQVGLVSALCRAI
jgi:hypothetical protein